MIYNTFIDNMLLHIYYYIMTESPDAHLRSQTFYLVHLGYQYNATYTVIKNQVTWFTASDACHQEVTAKTKFDACGTDCLRYINQKIKLYQ